jgi:hypothetical protein
MTRSVTTGAALALVLAFSATTVAVGQDGVPAEPVENPNTGEVSDMLIPQADAFETYAEHIRVLNACDWMGLMAQYPDNAEVHFNGDAMWSGRQEIGVGFAGFVGSLEEGGLCGLNFVEVSRLEVGGTENVKWVADADFLAEPYYGSDAYVSDGQFMVAMVTTFRGSDLVMAGGEAAEADDQADQKEDDLEDQADAKEDEADAKEDELEDKADAKEDELEDKVDG